jgi:hypothetical protein
MSRSSSSTVFGICILPVPFGAILPSSCGSLFGFSSIVLCIIGLLYFQMDLYYIINMVMDILARAAHDYFVNGIDEEHLTLQYGVGIDDLDEQMILSNDVTFDKITGGADGTNSSFNNLIKICKKMPRSTSVNVHRAMTMTRICRAANIDIDERYVHSDMSLKYENYLECVLMGFIVEFAEQHNLSPLHELPDATPENPFDWIARVAKGVRVMRGDLAARSAFLAVFGPKIILGE